MMRAMDDGKIPELWVLAAERDLRIALADAARSALPERFTLEFTCRGDEYSPAAPTAELVDRGDGAAVLVYVTRPAYLDDPDEHGGAPVPADPFPEQCLGPAAEAVRGAWDREVPGVPLYDVEFCRGRPQTGTYSRNLRAALGARSAAARPRPRPVERLTEDSLREEVSRAVRDALPERFVWRARLAGEWSERWSPAVRVVDGRDSVAPGVVVELWSGSRHVSDVEHLDRPGFPPPVEPFPDDRREDAVRAVRDAWRAILEELELLDVEFCEGDPPPGLALGVSARLRHALAARDDRLRPVVSVEALVDEFLVASRDVGFWELDADEFWRRVARSALRGADDEDGVVAETDDRRRAEARAIVESVDRALPRMLVGFRPGVDREGRRLLVVVLRAALDDRARAAIDDATGFGGAPAIVDDREPAWDALGQALPGIRFAVAFEDLYAHPRDPVRLLEEARDAASATPEAREVADAERAMPRGVDAAALRGVSGMVVGTWLAQGVAPEDVKRYLCAHVDAVAVFTGGTRDVPEHEPRPSSGGWE